MELEASLQERYLLKKKDGGPGHVGTIVLIGHSSNPSCLPGTVLVLWDNGKIQNYRAGMDLHG